MSKQIQTHIAEARRFLLTSNYPEEGKDFYGVLLDAAATAVNGTEDRPRANSQALALLAVAFVKQCVRQELARAPAGVDGWFRKAYPYRWPVCVFLSCAVFSPHVAAIVQIVAATWR